MGRCLGVVESESIFVFAGALVPHSMAFPTHQYHQHHDKGVGVLVHWLREQSMQGFMHKGSRKAGPHTQEPPLPQTTNATHPPLLGTHIFASFV